MGITLTYYRLTRDEYMDYCGQQQAGVRAFANDCGSLKRMRGVDVDKAYRDLQKWVEDIESLRFLTQGRSDSQLQERDYGASLPMFDPDEVRQIAAALRPLREMVSEKIWQEIEGHYPRQFSVLPEEEREELYEEHHDGGMSVWDAVVETFEEAAANDELIVVYYR